MVKHLEEKEDLKKLISKGKYIVDFYAEWCGPCKMLAPILEELESTEVIKVNTDLHSELAKEYGIMSVPTLLFTVDGEIKRKEIGFKTKEELEEMYKSI